MAKKQTFTSKLSKEEKNFKFVKHIKTVTSEDSGHIKFIANMVRLDDNENIDQALKRMEEKASITLAFGESAETEEVVTEEAPAEETQEEAPAEETQEEAPAEEEVPVEESSESVPEEDSAEQADESSKE
jgi:single-stranded DNA-specific DHH superfamily exonuclease